MKNVKVTILFIITVVINTYSQNLKTDSIDNANRLLKSKKLDVGEKYQGGIIAYIFQPGDPGYIAGEQHGIIAAPTDQTTLDGIKWYNNGDYKTTGAKSTALGTGKANTDAIVAAEGAGNYAAYVCKNLALGGYHDWYLPSKDELNKLYKNRDKIGGFTGEFYWSSSEFDKFIACFENFHKGKQYNDYKLNPCCVRAIRYF